MFEILSVIEPVHVAFSLRATAVVVILLVIILTPDVSRGTWCPSLVFRSAPAFLSWSYSYLTVPAALRRCLDCALHSGRQTHAEKKNADNMRTPSYREIQAWDSGAETVATARVSVGKLSPQQVSGLPETWCYFNARLTIVVRSVGGRRRCIGAQLKNVCLSFTDDDDNNNIINNDIKNKRFRTAPPLQTVISRQSSLPLSLLRVLSS